MPGPELIVRGLSTGYPRRPVIRSLDLPPIASGQVTALVGPNAAGKSTFLLALAGMLKASGSVRFGDNDILDLDPVRRARLVTFMPQASSEGVQLTVLDSVIAALKASPGDDIHGEEEPTECAVAVLDRLGLAGIAMEGLDRLSGGQRQLVSLAQALVRQPRLLLLDEPTSALDLRHQVLVMSLVRALAEEGRCIIVVMHDLNLAARWADQVIVFDRGAVHAAGAPAEALVPEVIAAVYGVAARVERCSQQHPQIIVDYALDAPASPPETP